MFASYLAAYCGDTSGQCQQNPRHRMLVSEKTLELNVSAELLSRFRTKYPSNHIFIIGSKQYQEDVTGVDAFINNLPDGKILALQFKAPKHLAACPHYDRSRHNILCQPVTNPYPKMHFTINDRQNDNLLSIANYFPDSAYYVLPHFSCYPSVVGESPNLLNGTWFLRVSELRGTPQSSNKQGTHTVKTHAPSDGWATIHSEPFEIRLTSHEGFVEIAGGEGAIEAGFFREWLMRTVREVENRHVLGQLLRGLAIVYLDAQVRTT